MKTRKSTDTVAMKLHIRVVAPVSGCIYAMQRGKADIEQAVTAKDVDIEFTLDVSPRTAANGNADISGPNVQGPLGGRFVYINSGTLAGQTGTCWTRRAKVPLSGVIAMLGNASRGDAFEASINGRARDGGPACGSVPLLGAGWTLFTV